MYRLLLIPMLLLSLSACTAVTSEVRETIEYALKDAENAELSQEKIDSFPYTSLYARWGDSPRSLIVLGFVNKPDDWHFVTAEKETLVLRNGRVIRTQGLNENLLAVSNLQNDPLRCLVTHPTSCNTQWQRQYDIESKQAVVSREATSSFSVKNKTTLDLPIGPVKTTHVVETGQFTLSGDHFINEFWLEDDGHVVKSTQTLFPSGKALTLTQVTWIGRDYSESRRARKGKQEQQGKAVQ
ncbi:YjbF family lipoprotein [Idiomarina sp. HP20-50]|uniref:YjbF family lipoprotein n=1 Tax=Idiomarina sp. HP20-50 TaxID=3070813 RepID=UPI00294B54A8|nr:YjbF family lipoprotein [Idiomarina sp. HP20-50]MDV6316119.1 YjbF family lipoprotein [Idiomarina sp. HP20-50]